MIKKITRSLLFSALALLVTTYWNKGFIVPIKPDIIAEVILVTAVGYYLIIPVIKIILLPVNFLTFGFASTLVYVLFFYLMDTQINVIDVKQWVYVGFNWQFLTMPPITIPYAQNLLLIAVSVSYVISAAETIV
jgi:uncharacterized membrane protein YvlD (DUF360 family)